MNSKKNILLNRSFLFSYQTPSCSICLEDLSEDIATLRCGHCFHEKCIRGHLNAIEKCPYCRSNVERKHVIPLFFKLTKRQQEEPFSSKELVQMKFLTELQTIDEYKIAVQKLIERNKKEKYQKMQYKNKRNQVLQKRNEYIVELKTSLEKMNQQIKAQLKQILSDKEEEIENMKIELDCLHHQKRQLDSVITSNAHMYDRVKAERDSYKHQFNLLWKKHKTEYVVFPKEKNSEEGSHKKKSRVQLKDQLKGLSRRIPSTLLFRSLKS